MRMLLHRFLLGMMLIATIDCIQMKDFGENDPQIPKRFPTDEENDPSKEFNYLLFLDVLPTKQSRMPAATV